MKRLFAAFATGSVLFAGSFGFAQIQAFATGGVAAQGTTTASACEANMNVFYKQTAGVVTGVEVTQSDGGDNCAGLAVTISVQGVAPGNVVLGTGSGEVNGPGITLTPSISNVQAIDHAVVTITDN